MARAIVPGRNSACGASTMFKTRRKAAKLAAFEATAMKAVTGVGAPW